MPADAYKRTFVIFRFWFCSHESSLPTKEKIISRALAHPVGLLRKPLGYLESQLRRWSATGKLHRFPVVC